MWSHLVFFLSTLSLVWRATWYLWAASGGFTFTFALCKLCSSFPREFGFLFDFFFSCLGSGARVSEERVYENFLGVTFQHLSPSNLPSEQPSARPRNVFFFVLHQMSGARLYFFIFFSSQAPCCLSHSDSTTSKLRQEQCTTAFFFFFYRIFHPSFHCSYNEEMVSWFGKRQASSIDELD